MSHDSAVLCFSSPPPTHTPGSARATTIARGRLGPMTLQRYLSDRRAARGWSDGHKASVQPERGTTPAPGRCDFLVPGRTGCRYAAEGSTGHSAASSNSPFFAPSRKQSHSYRLKTDTSPAASPFTRNSTQSCHWHPGLPVSPGWCPRHLEGGLRRVPRRHQGRLLRHGPPSLGWSAH